MRKHGHLLDLSVPAPAAIDENDDYQEDEGKSMGGTVNTSQTLEEESKLLQAHVATAVCDDSETLNGA